MNKTRLEAFSDGVLAIIITIMVLEIKVPHGVDFNSLKPILPVFLSYILSFIYVGIYWNNHHHMMHTVKQVSGEILWANLHLLFWLSLIPFVTAWIGENHFAPFPMTMYGVILLMCAVAYFILQALILKKHGPDSVLSKAIGKDIKGKLSPVFYILGIIASSFNGLIAGGFYVLVAIMWLIPDNRIEKIVAEKED
ncbi:TMEM175 family protein [Flavobacterium inviolabile]|uniref:TMEM175 family protein n=1 Tax=Flavobacterium inviolabile TaxID=2748320 RepID=UPI0015A87D62|nr:TMEM175 family protein [Flavobacterium inviolabile]